MGLIKQCDDQMGRLFAWMQAAGRMEDTLIVLTSDHGDYLGDHWMGEKDLFHDCSAKVPLIVYDPSAAADATRGTVCDALVEAIDLAPTFVEAAGGAAPPHILEGRSLIPWLHGQTPPWRDFAVSEYNYALQPAAAKLGVAARDARLVMIADQRWKFMHAEGFRAQLFDLLNDPDELCDLGADPAYDEITAMMRDRLAVWARRPAQMTTMDIEQMRAERGKATGIVIGVWSENDLPARETMYYTGKPRPAETP